MVFFDRGRAWTGPANGTGARADRRARVLNDVDDAALDSELAAMEAAGLKASGMAFDVIDADAREAAVPAIIAEQ